MRDLWHCISMHSTTLPVAAHDALGVSLRRIETLAALLCALSDRVPCEPLDGEVVGEAAGMIAEETTRLRATLNSNLKERLIRSSPPTAR